MEVKTKIKKTIDGHHQVQFTIGVQTFYLEKNRTEGRGRTSYQLAKWYMRMLKKAFANLKKQTLSTPSDEEPFGYYFNGRIYENLDDLRGRTMSEDNQPVPLYTRPKQQASE